MRILQVNTVCGQGSTGKIAASLQQKILATGNNGIILYGRGDNNGVEPAIRFSNSLGVKVHVALTRLTDKHGLYSRHSTKGLIKSIEKFQPDLIHLHNIHGYYLSYELLFEYLIKIDKPIIWTLHDCWAFTGHCAYFDYINCSKWCKACEHCPQSKSYPKSVLADRSKKNFLQKKQSFTFLERMILVTPSFWLKDKVGKSFLNVYDCKVIPNGIDTTIFKPTHNSFRDRWNAVNKKIILGVANVWDRRKGLDDFIKLSKIVDESVQIVLVGISQKQLATLPKNIIGIMHLSNSKELAQIYTAADILFNPTYEDNYPTVNLEAIACGTPVITYNTGGSVESIDEYTGKVIEQGRYQDVVALMNDCTKITDHKNKFSNDIFLDKYMALYRELLK